MAATALQAGQAKRATVTERKRRKFLDLVADGLSIVKAAEGAKLARQTVYNWRRDDPDFAREWDNAFEAGADLLEDVAQTRAVDGSDLMTIFLLKGRRPQRYRDNVKHESDVRVTVTVDDARSELVSRLGMIEDHRRAAVDGKATRAIAPPTDVA